MAIAAAAAAAPAVAARHLYAALRLLAWPDSTTEPELTARLLITLAHAEAEQGRTAQGLELLDRAESMVAPADRATLLQQRGLLLLRAGRIDAAQRQLDAVLPALAQDGEPVVLARTLLNRAVSHLTAGRVRLARADLERCRALAQAHGLDLVAAKCVHNIGYCELLSGDLPAALRSFDAAAGSLSSTLGTAD